MPHSVKSIVEELKELAAKDQLATSVKRGVPASEVIGVSTSDIRKLAKRIGEDHALAESLWKSHFLEARTLAILIYPRKISDDEHLNRWLSGISDWSLCDLFVKTLVSKRGDATQYFRRWISMDGVYQKRAGLALIANYCMRAASVDSDTREQILGLLGSAAHDNREHVRQACCWALRELGKVDEVCREEAIMLALNLLASKNDPENWVGRCAHRELESLVKVPERRRLISRNSKTGMIHRSGHD